MIWIIKQKIISKKKLDKNNKIKYIIEKWIFK